MIRQENLIINGKRFIKTYSDQNYYIKQLPTNILYSEAIDVETAPYTYVETDEVIEVENNGGNE